MKLVNINGKKTVIINTFVDPESGFSNPFLTDEDGGVLYVPGGEAVAPIMGKIIQESRGSIFILGQDYHPKNHISFMVNHPGVMEYRIEEFKKFLKAHGQPIPEDADELYLRAQKPVHVFSEPEEKVALFPFPEIVLDENRDIFGLKEADGRIRQVRVETSSGLEPGPKDRGRVTKALDEYHRKTFDQYRAEGRLLRTQTLWTMHCVQGSKSCLYPASMNLPLGLQVKLAGDLASPVIFHRDANTGNEFWVIRKGMNSEIDSYGIGVENDGKALTKAWDVFGDIADQLERLGCENVIINGGGLATNFCTEFTLNNLSDFLQARFKMRGMNVQINYAPEISRGIPIPGGIETPFSLDGTEGRLKKHGIEKITVEQIMTMSPKAVVLPKPIFPVLENHA